MLYLFYLLAFLIPLSSNGSLIELEKRLWEEQKLLNFDKLNWRDPSQEAFDVVIVGGGMSGLCASYALMKQGITHQQIYDQNPEGREGVWLNARMKTLRSGKDFVGPALNTPLLTFQAWYIAQYGEQSWKVLGKIPTTQWMEYLKWYRHVLKLPVKNGYTLIDFQQEGDLIRLKFAHEGYLEEVLTRKLVLATGRDGCGGLNIPSVCLNLPKQYWAHSAESINMPNFKQKKVCVIGCGASGFDAAAALLEKGAAKVTMLMRRAYIPCVNKFASFAYQGFLNGYYKLSDEDKFLFMKSAFELGIPPPIEALKRVRSYDNFIVKSNTYIQQAYIKNEKVILETNKDTFEVDFLVLATGFAIDIEKQKELHAHINHIMLWKDLHPCSQDEVSKKLAQFPYLGSGFEFIEKQTGRAAYLKNIHCFNYGATLSHGLGSSDIYGISVGASRLAEAIAADLFTQQKQIYYQELSNYNKKAFDEKDFPFIEK